MNTPRVVLCAPQSYCRLLCTLECHTGWCSWAQGSGQVPISTVCTPPIFRFPNRLPKSAKILISQSLANFLYSELNESNFKTTTKKTHRIRFLNAFWAVHMKQITDCLSWKGPWAALGSSTQDPERVSDWPKVTQQMCSRAQHSILGLGTSWPIYQAFLAENL